MRKLLGVLALSISATAVAYASPSPHSSDTNGWNQTQGGWTQGQMQTHDGWFGQSGDTFQNWFHNTWGQGFGTSSHHGHYGTFAAPEFDPASALAALTFLSGGLAVLRGRRSKRQ